MRIGFFGRAPTHAVEHVDDELVDEQDVELWTSTCPRSISQLSNDLLRKDPSADAYDAIDDLRDVTLATFSRHPSPHVGQSLEKFIFSENLSRVQGDTEF